MISSDLLSQSWDELGDRARRAIAQGDVEALTQVDAALHYHFVNQVRRGKRTSQAELMQHILNVTESPEARSLEEPPVLQRFLCVWEHLALLMHTLRDDGDLIDDAERVLHSRAHASALLEALRAATGWGVQAKALAAQLGISAQHLAILLHELELHNIIRRHKVGRQVYVSPSLLGRQVLERRAQTPPRPVASPLPRSPQHAPDFAMSSPAHASLTNPSHWLTGDAA